MRAIDPMLFVIVTSVALARSSLLMESRFSLLIMCPKLHKIKVMAKDTECTGIIGLLYVKIGPQSLI